MKERPILFSRTMVRALLDGSKTQTRRVVKGFALELLQPDNFTPEYVALPENSNSPYGYAGDRLWVRETWNTSARCLPPVDEPYIYAADLNSDGKMFWAATWKPSIHMPRAASRITLEVTGVRVERLQGISIRDAVAEGATPKPPHVACSMVCPEDYLTGFRDLWNSINGPEAWNANPWVWVVEFKRAGG